MTAGQATEVFGLTGKTAIVTGASNGIGKAVALLFAQAGARVVAADIDVAAAEDLARSANNGMMALHLDQADPSSVTSMFEELGKRVDRLDVLVNCAGIYPRAPFETLEVDFYDRMLDVNLRGVFLCTREAVKQMKGKGGSIVNISSIGAVRTTLYDTIPYGISKAGVNGLTMMVALEYAEYDIRINAIMPGGVATDRAENQHSGGTLRGPFMQPGRLPLGGRLGQPSDIANAALYFASDASRYVTGQILAVDGGFLIS